MTPNRQHLSESHIGNMSGHGIGDVSGGDDDHAQFVGREGGQFRGKTINRAVVADSPTTFKFCNVEADAEALGRLISLTLRLPSPMHPLERFKEICAQLEMIGGARSIGFRKS